MNLLLVDTVNSRINFFIERFGHHLLDITETSVGAIQNLNEKKYDLIFIGGQLSDGGYGSDVAEWLAEHSENKNYTSFIFIHTWNSVEIELSITALPNAEFIPFDEGIYSTLSI